MTKTMTSIYLESSVLAAARRKRLNVSATCEAALRRELGGSDIEALERERTAHEAALKSLDAEMHAVGLEAKAQVSKQELALKEFLETTSEKVIINPVAMRNWAESTGKTIDELVALHKERR